MLLRNTAKVGVSSLYEIERNTSSLQTVPTVVYPPTLVADRGGQVVAGFFGPAYGWRVPFVTPAPGTPGGAFGGNLRRSI